ncbi:hypothetical protein THTE_1382 [Thermogutta terrifontis]|uniref:Uncharacterized protein n=1 Tax=Thermogutta terrifontis TaxID=1331910 RepID=A0A286RDE7_9BACT|nr:hypothetical protein THTE_1382 [Thermogutta terrifontis]
MIWPCLFEIPSTLNSPVLARHIAANTRLSLGLTLLTSSA